ncbi:3501_t:CDS:2 [Ambispora leptoticha]|uniref:3501_t:CDS:1 n=1 Tax=Ambispora leptoticha TaxID=144679 RepID=A0A9N8ZAQ2_9GLOM|nr:3501_t:CDS:2 [Ambispora leptoticha]
MAIQRSDKAKLAKTATQDYNSLREESSKSRSVVAGSKETLKQREGGSSKFTISQNHGDIVNKRPIPTNGNPKVGGGGGAVKSSINSSVRKHSSVGDHSKTPYSKILSLNKGSVTTTPSVTNGNRHLPRENLDGLKSGAIRKDSNGKNVIARDSSSSANDHKKAESNNTREGSTASSFKALVRTPRPLARPAPNLIKADTSRTSCDTLSPSHKITSLHLTQKQPSLTNRTSSSLSSSISKTSVSPSTQKAIQRVSSTIKAEKRPRSLQAPSRDEQRPQSRQSLSAPATLRKRPERDFSPERRPAKRPATGHNDNLQSVLFSVFGYDRRRYRDDYSDDDDMEVSGLEVLREEARSAKIGYQEDKREEMLERQRMMQQKTKTPRPLATDAAPRKGCK